MLGNRSRDTGPELLVRRALHARGLRFRVDLRPEPTLRTRADIVFTRRRIAVYIDGCFWHGCPVHGTSPKANADYWTPKLARNVERDRESTAALESLATFWLRRRIEAGGACRGTNPPRTRGRPDGSLRIASGSRRSKECTCRVRDTPS
jgi:DNA mismatch endonuclease (patch repair protein)